jgi:hypothetical protein
VNKALKRSECRLIFILAFLFGMTRTSAMLTKLFHRAIFHLKKIPSDFLKGHSQEKFLEIIPLNHRFK